MIYGAYQDRLELSVPSNTEDFNESKSDIDQVVLSLPLPIDLEAATTIMANISRNEGESAGCEILVDLI